MPIRVLPPEVAGKIAAGEVIERPASVVKELVENSIDADASEIQVTIRDGGRRLIRVADNGCGIPAGDVPLAFARHATSKLQDVSDLERITSLGFRGEALASIAAVSRVTLLSRPAQQPVAQTLQIEDSQVIRQEPSGGPSGTIVTVEHIFRNVPARLKFLRQPQTEAGHIQDIVAHYALAHPQIRFGLSIDDRQSFQTTGNGQRYDVLISAFGLEAARQMIALEDDLGPDQDYASAPDTSVSGYVGVPALHRASRNYVSLFVNRRWIQDRTLSHAVIQAYHTLLPVGRYPVAVILLDMDPAQVDVNVHPTKRECRFRDARRVFSAVERAVRRTLVERAPIPVLGPAARTWPSAGWEGLSRPFHADQTHRSSAQLALELDRADAQGTEPQPIGPIRLPLLRVVGQVGQTYIVAEGPQGIYLIDQHAAHERVLYEQMSGSSKGPSATVASQVLLEPLTLDLEPLLAGVLGEHLETLNQLGFDLHPFGDNTYLLRAVPSVLALPDVRLAMLDILELLHQDDDLLATHAEERLIAAVCKRAAIKAGETLSLDEMQQLIRQLELCDAPRTCPHGRPTVLHFSVDQLEKQFSRR